MTEEWIRTMAGTHMEADEALTQIGRAVDLAIVLSRAGLALDREVQRLRAERDAALNLAEGYAPDLVQRLRDQMAFDREEGR